MDLEGFAAGVDGGGTFAGDARPSDARPVDGGAADGRAVDAARDGLAGDGGMGDVPRPIDASAGSDARTVDSGSGGSGDGGAFGDAGGDAGQGLVRIDISPAAPTIGVGTNVTLTVTASFANGATTNVTAASAFQSSAPAIVSTTGAIARGLAAGAATITATYMGRTATARVMVTAAPLTSISIEPADGRVTVGGRLDLRATAAYADGAKQDVTGLAIWASSDAQVASVGNLDPARGQVTGVRPGSVAITASVMNVVGRATVEVTGATVRSIEVTPTRPVLATRVTRQFQATATYSDGTTGDVTAQATWSSSDAGVAMVIPDGPTRGLVTTIAPGMSTITATLAGAAGAGATTGSTPVTVTPSTLAALQVTPAMAIISPGGTQAFTATGTYSDGTTADVSASVVWSSTVESIATVSNAAASRGVVTGLSAGMTRIVATLGAVSAAGGVTVSVATLSRLAVSPNAPTIAVGHKAQLAATATYSDGTTRDVTQSASWVSSDPAIVAVTNAAGSAGQVTALKAGAAKVTASLDGQSDTAGVTVTNATLDQITVSPPSATVTAGSTQAFRASGIYSDGTTGDVTAQVTWSSDNLRVASVSNASASKGVATGITGGTTTIRASLDGKQGTATFAVNEPTVLSVFVAPLSATIRVGQMQNFQAQAIMSNGTTRNVTGMAAWVSTDTAVATITVGMGGMGMFGAAQARGLAAGTTTIRATYMDKVGEAPLTVSSATMTGLTVTPTNAALRVGENQLFVASALFSDGSSVNVSPQAMWSTSNPAVATVQTIGAGPGGIGRIAIARGAGTTTITATYMGLQASATLTVTAPMPVSLAVTPPLVTLRVGQMQPLQAIVVFDDGSDANVTGLANWMSTVPSVAVVSSGFGPGGGGGRGVVTAIGAGVTSIQAMYLGLTATASVTVRAATLTSIMASPPTATILVGQMQAFQAVALFDDGTDQNVSFTATFASSDPAVAIFAGGGGGGPGPGPGPGPGAPQNVAIGLKAGSITVTASYMGKTATAGLVVTSPKLLSVQVTPTNPSIPKGGFQQFTATALYDDFSVRNVTGAATWLSSNPAVAPVSNAAATGRADALSVGTTEITAVFEGLRGSTTLTVTSASVTSIQVTPTNPAVPMGINQRFVATALLSDNTTQDVTQMVTWTSSDASVASISNVAGNQRGVATPLKPGMTIITATLPGTTSPRTASTTLTVTAAKLQSIVVTPATPTIARGARQQFTATARYDDGATFDVTGLATWISSDTAVATVSNAAGSRGLATGVAAGMTNIQAWFQSVTGMTSMTVTP